MKKTLLLPQSDKSNYLKGNSHGNSFVSNSHGFLLVGFFPQKWKIQVPEKGLLHVVFSEGYKEAGE